MKQLQYGILGAASIVPRFAGAVQQTTHSVVSAIASRDKAKAAAFAEKLSIPTSYSSYEALLNDPSIDIVYIPTTNDTHYELIKQSLLARKHVLCEKPFVLFPDQAEELFALAAKQQLFLMEAQKSVFLPVHQRVKDWIMQKPFGELRQVDMIQSYDPQWPEGHWMLDKNQGGALFGSAAYPIELMMFLLGDHDFSYVINGTKTKDGCLDAVTMTFVNHNSIVVTARSVMNVEMKNAAIFYFDHGTITVPEYWKARHATVWDRQTHTTEQWEFPCPYEMVYEVDHVYDCIMQGRLVSDVMSAAVTIRCVDVVRSMFEFMEQQK